MSFTELLIITGDPANNQLGRAQAVYRVARAAGFDVQVVTSVQAAPTWAPLVGSDIDQVLDRVSRRELSRRVRQGSRLPIVIKPRWDSLGAVIISALKANAPMIVDIDDPDLEVLRELAVKGAGGPALALARYGRYTALRRATFKSSRLTSNPVLQRRYGGEVLPHARPDPGIGMTHASASPRIAFIGTPKVHKGIDELREAVAQVAVAGFQLAITAHPPDGVTPQPWEHWLGPLNERQSMQLLRESDIVALPSLNQGWGKAQLPMKIVDGMLAGRAIVASDLEPIAWALGGTGSLVTPGSVQELVAALLRYRNPTTRAEHGAAARQHALQRYTPEALVPVFSKSVKGALG